MEALGSVRDEKTERNALIDRYVEEVVDSIIFGDFSVEDLKELHQEINERNRQIAHNECKDELNVDSLRFMHQVTKQAMKAVGTKKKLTTQRARRSIRLRNSVVE